MKSVGSTGWRSCAARRGSWKQGPERAPLLFLIRVSLDGSVCARQCCGNGLLAYVLIELGLGVESGRISRRHPAGPHSRTAACGP